MNYFDMQDKTIFTKSNVVYWNRNSLVNMKKLVIKIHYSKIITMLFPIVEGHNDTNFARGNMLRVWKCKTMEQENYYKSR